MAAFDVRTLPKSEDYCGVTQVSLATAWHKDIREKKGCRLNKKIMFEKHDNLYRRIHSESFGMGTVFIAAVTLSYAMICYFYIISILLPIIFPAASLSYFDVCHDVSFLYIFLILYLINKIAQHYLYHDNTQAFIIFHRDTAKVEVKGRTEQFDFKDFIPMVHTSYMRHSLCTGMSLIHKSRRFSYPLSVRSVGGAVVRWHYLAQFMDKTRPLPDTPEHEATRHLDPTTAAYDKRVKRDSYYWRRKTYKELRVMRLALEKKVQERFKDYKVY